MKIYKNIHKLMYLKKKQNIKYMGCAKVNTLVEKDMHVYNHLRLVSKAYSISAGLVSQDDIRRFNTFINQYTAVTASVLEQGSNIYILSKLNWINNYNLKAHFNILELSAKYKNSYKFKKFLTFFFWKNRIKLVVAVEDLPFKLLKILQSLSVIRIGLITDFSVRHHYHYYFFSKCRTHILMHLVTLSIKLIIQHYNRLYRSMFVKKLLGV